MNQIDNGVRTIPMDPSERFPLEHASVSNKVRNPAGNRFIHNFDRPRPVETNAPFLRWLRDLIICPVFFK
jgi:hypothetical protein